MVTWCDVTLSSALSWLRHLALYLAPQAHQLPNVYCDIFGKHTKGSTAWQIQCWLGDALRFCSQLTVDELLTDPPHGSHCGCRPTHASTASARTTSCKCLARCPKRSLGVPPAPRNRRMLSRSVAPSILSANFSKLGEEVSFYPSQPGLHALQHSPDSI